MEQYNGLFSMTKILLLNSATMGISILTNLHEYGKVALVYMSILYTIIKVLEIFGIIKPIKFTKNKKK